MLAILTRYSRHFSTCLHVIQRVPEAPLLHSLMRHIFSWHSIFIIKLQAFMIFYVESTAVKKISLRHVRVPFLVRLPISIFSFVRIFSHNVYRGKTSLLKSFTTGQYSLLSRASGQGFYISGTGCTGRTCRLYVRTADGRHNNGRDMKISPWNGRTLWSCETMAFQMLTMVCLA